MMMMMLKKREKIIKKEWHPGCKKASKYLLRRAR